MLLVGVISPGDSRTPFSTPIDGDPDRAWRLFASRLKWCPSVCTTPRKPHNNACLPEHHPLYRRHHDDLATHDAYKCVLKPEKSEGRGSRYLTLFY